MTGRRRQGVGSAVSGRPWGLAWAAVLSVWLGWLCVGVARADYIAEVKEGPSRGYLYIGEGAIKRQGLPGWSVGDLILRDDKEVMYFTTRRLGPRPGTPGGPPASQGSQQSPQEKLKEVQRELEASGGDFSVSEWGRELQEPEVPTYETRVVPYSAVQKRRDAVKGRLLSRLRDAQAHIGDPGMVRFVATLQPFLSGKPQWTNTGETKVIAGRQCTKYRVWVAPIFKLDVWMTEELGPGYTAGQVFDKVFDMRRGGIRFMEVLARLPGFPLKIKGEYRNVLGSSIMKIDYEVLSLVETDLDEKEFEPRPGSLLYQGELPGWGY